MSRSPTPLATQEATGTFVLDPAHTRLGFAVRHMVTPIHGRFTEFSGSGLLVADEIESSTVDVTITAASIQTHQPDRDGHLRSADFFDVENHPTITFHSTGVRRSGDGIVVTGDLTVKGTARSVDLEFASHGTAMDPYGLLRIGFTGTGRVSRRDFGLVWNVALEAGGFVLADEVILELEIAAIVSPHA